MAYCMYYVRTRRHGVVQRFPTCGSRPHVGSPSIFIGVATSREAFKKFMHNCASTMLAPVCVKNCALSKLIVIDSNISMFYIL